MSQYHDSPEKAEDEVERTEAETDPVDDTEGPEGDGWQDDPAARINALEGEVANLKDQLLRALAKPRTRAAAPSASARTPRSTAWPVSRATC